MTESKRNILVTGISGVIAVVLIIIWAMMTGGDDPQRAWRALLINYLYFTSAAAGLLVWPAVVVACEGEWMGRLERLTRIGLAFSIPSIIILVILWAGSVKWAPWIGLERHKFWLNNTFLFVRNIILQIIFWGTAIGFLRNRNRKNIITISAWFIIIYAVTFSIAGFDFIMALNPEWHSMMFGGYFFISGLYLAAVVWAFFSIVSGRPEKKSLTDIGKLIVAFSLLATYTMYSQLLPIWYENLPDETTFVIPLQNLAWKPVSYIMIFLVFLGPLILLMTRTSKSTYLYTGFVTAILICGLWMEKWWLVSSGFELNHILFGWTEIVPAIAFIAVVVAGTPIVLKIK